MTKENNRQNVTAGARAGGFTDNSFAGEGWDV